MIEVQINFEMGGVEAQWDRSFNLVVANDGFSVLLGVDRLGFIPGDVGRGRDLLLRSAPGGSDLAFESIVGVVGAQHDRGREDHPSDGGAYEDESESGNMAKHAVDLPEIDVGILCARIAPNGEARLFKKLDGSNRACECQAKHRRVLG